MAGWNELVRGRSLISQVGFLVEMIVSAMWAIKLLPTDREHGLGGKVEIHQRVFDLGVRKRGVAVRTT
jgi:hypothetical protein